MKEWCEEAGEWIGQDDDKFDELLWWHTCLYRKCPFYDGSKAIMEERKLYWAGESVPNYYDITYEEKYFCPIFQKYLYPARDVFFNERKGPTF